MNYRKIMKNKLKKLDFSINQDNYYNNSIFELKIDKSYIEDAGLGVFAEENIPKNSFIGFYEGENIDYHPDNTDYFFVINDYNGIDAYKYPRCYMAMLNDARKSYNNYNCEFRIDDKNLLVEVWSIKNIMKGEELFIYYGSDYWNK